jgi:hypothetical protein
MLWANNAGVTKEQTMWTPDLLSGYLVRIGRGKLLTCNGGIR